jgi:hypothetical protein
MGYVADNIIQELRGSHMLGVFFRLDTDDPLRLWMGFNDIPEGIENVDPDTNQTYLGGFRLVNVPELEILLNGAADRANFSLSGIDPDTSALADIDFPPVRGKDVHVGITTLDDHYQPMSSIIPLMKGKASFIREQEFPSKGTGNTVVSL